MLLRGLIENMRNPTGGTNAIRGTAPGFYLRGTRAVGILADPLSRAVGDKASRLANHWRNILNGTERTAWDTYATAHPAKKHSGRSVTLNGWQWFSRINHSRLTLNIPILTPPPPTAIDYEAPITDFDTTIPGVLLLTFNNSAAWTTDPEAVAIVADTGPAGTGVQVSKTYGRIAGTFPGLPTTGYPLPLVIPRPFPLATGGTVFTYVTWIG